MIPPHTTHTHTHTTHPHHTPHTHTTHTTHTQRDGGGASQVVKKVKSVMGTDGDLRKLKLSKAKNLLRNFGVAEDEVSCNVCVYVYM